MRMKDNVEIIDRPSEFVKLQKLLTIANTANSGK